MKKILIREARLEDSEFIIQAQISMALETEKMQLDLPTVRKGVAAVFENSHHGLYYVAENQGSKEPIACLLTVPEWSDWRNGKILWIHSVYVSPAHRGLGVYKKMYEHLKAMVGRDAGLRGLRLYVDHSNKSAQTVYQKLGMNNDHYQLYEWMKS